MKSAAPFAPPEIKRVPSRFRQALSKYRITLTSDCDNCGLCVTLCPYGVLSERQQTPPGGPGLSLPGSFLP